MEKKGMENNFKGEKRRLAVFFTAISVVILILSLFLAYYAAYGDILFTILGNKSLKAKRYDEMNLSAQKGQTVFFGDSLTEFYDTSAAFPSFTSYNRGISGDTTDGMLERLDGNLLAIEPSKIIFLGGANDLNHGLTPDEIVANIREILTRIKKALPDCEVFVQSLYPVNPYTQPTYLNSVADRKNSDILAINEALAPLCEELGCTYINVHDSLTDENGNLREELTMDGLHVNEEGYAIVTEILSEYLLPSESRGD